MALWQQSDILISFRHSDQPPGPGLSAVGAWYFDGSDVQQFRGWLELSPPLASTAEALQNLTYANNVLLGREQQDVPANVWSADGEQNTAQIFYQLPQFSGGGIATDLAGNIYVGVFNSGLQIVKFDASGTVVDTFPYTDASLPTGDGTATKVRTNNSGSIVYFNTLMSNWGTSIDQSSAYINRYDTNALGLLSSLDFTYNGGNLQEPQRFWDFDVGPDDRIYGLYEDVNNVMRVFITDLDGTVVQDWPLAASLLDIGSPEAIMVNCNATEIFVHENYFNGDPPALQGYNEIGQLLHKLNYTFDIPGGPNTYQPEGIVFANNRGDCGIVVLDAFFAFVTLIGAN